MEREQEPLESAQERDETNDAFENDFELRHGACFSGRRGLFFSVVRRYLTIPAVITS